MRIKDVAIWSADYLRCAKGRVESTLSLNHSRDLEVGLFLDELCEQGGGFAHEGFEGKVEAGEGVGLIEEGLGFFGDMAGDADDFFSGVAGELGDSGGAFTVESLSVEGTFTGDDEIGGGDFFIELKGIGDEVETADKFGSAEGFQAKSESACGTCTWEVMLSFEEICQAGEGGFELGNSLGSRSFLWTENGGGSVWPKQGVGDITSDGDGREGNYSRLIDGDDLGKGFWDEDEGKSSVIEELNSKRFRHASSTVIGGGTTDADEETLGF